jgi:hypothetical protein
MEPEPAPAAPRKPFQFTLRTLFIVMTVFALVLGLVMSAVRYWLHRNSSGRRWGLDIAVTAV